MADTFQILINPIFRAYQFKISLFFHENYGNIRSQYCKHIKYVALWN